MSEFVFHVLATCDGLQCNNVFSSLVMLITEVRCFWAISHVNFTRFCNVSSQTRR